MPKKKTRPVLTFERYAQIYYEMLGYRRLYCEDNITFKMSDFWRDLAADISEIKLKLHNGGGVKAGLMVFDELATLVAPAAMFERADRGCKFANFTLGHEMGHFGLSHHDDGKVIKNFQLFSDETGLANLPPTVEELEANVAAVCFQCGVFLFDPKLSDWEVARNCYTDSYYVSRFRKKAASDRFKKELDRLFQPKIRVVL